ncbi:hypothetical protein V8C42DRAFT_324243 [Trichoderma barbatum]
MFDKKTAMQLSDANSSFQMTEDRPEATYNSQAVHTATGMGFLVDIEKTAHTAYNAQCDKVKSIQQALRQLGRCEAGFDRVRDGSGFRCKGGSHYVSDAQVQSNS